MNRMDEHLLKMRMNKNENNLEENLELAMLHRRSLTRIVLKHMIEWAQQSVDRLPIRVTLGNLGALAVILAIVLPKTLTYIILYPIFRLVFGTLYPAYASYKAVRTQNLKEYIKWMMYWIVFALFTCAETFTDVFFSFWFPFYYEIKIILVIWLLSPATKGSSILYRRFVHPALTQREAEIDEALARATEQGYKAVLHLGTRGVNYATTVLMQTAIKNLPSIIPSPPNESPASQSDPAIFSSASLIAAPLSTRQAQDKMDTVDGEPMAIEGKSKVTRRTRKKQQQQQQVERNAEWIPDDGDCHSNSSSTHDPDTDDVRTDWGEQYDNLLDEMVNDENSTNPFKEPEQRLTRAKKSMKEHGGAKVRRQKSKSHRTTSKVVYDPEFSDNTDCW